MNARLHRQLHSHHPARPGFTLTEMLVVIGIIAVLAALLIPTAAGALSRARDSAMGMEIQKLQQAIENYKLENGDYPPSFGDTSVVMRHIRKCFPKVDSAHLNDFITRLNNASTGTTPNIDIDQSEALVFWLSATSKNPTLPFKYPAVDPGDGIMPIHAVDTNAEFRGYYDFDARRLEDPDGDGFPSFKPQYAKNTYYVYVDSRSYFLHMNFPAPSSGTRPAARAEGTEVVRPYFSDTFDSTNVFGFKFVNPTTYQILCAGQDGEWGPLSMPSSTTFPLTPDTSPPPMTGVHQRTAARGIKRFPSGRDGRGNVATDTDPSVASPGGAYVLVEEDLDNLGNFSGGRTMKANLP